MTVRQGFVIVSIVLLLLLVIWGMYWPPAKWILVPVLALVALGIHDLLQELLAAAGLESLEDLKPSHIQQRVDGTVVRNYDELYPPLVDGCLLQESTIPPDWKSAWNNADACHW